ncbi:MAG: hypothetical protein M3439_03545, partial [Chloroflexota bacterium]|nr:hypothetical protein [Chloroflexota bacterium]
MAKMTLDQAWTFNGKVYGPGETEVPDDAAKAIKDRQGDVDAPMQAEDPNMAGLETASDDTATAESTKPTRGK